MLTDHIPQVLGNLEHKALAIAIDIKGGKNGGEFAIELHVNNGANDLDHAALAGRSGSQATHCIKQTNQTHTGHEPFSQKQPERRHHHGSHEVNQFPT